MIPLFFFLLGFTVAVCIFYPLGIRYGRAKGGRDAAARLLAQAAENL